MFPNKILSKFYKTLIQVYVRQVFVNVWRNSVSSGHFVRQVLKFFLQPCELNIEQTVAWSNTCQNAD